MEAQDWCRKYMRSGNVKDLTQAWDLYYHVFRRISKQLPQVRQLTHQGSAVQWSQTKRFWLRFPVICYQSASLSKMPFSLPCSLMAQVSG